VLIAYGTQDCFLNVIQVEPCKRADKILPIRAIHEIEFRPGLQQKPQRKNAFLLSPDAFPGFQFVGDKLQYMLSDDTTLDEVFAKYRLNSGYTYEWI
jgi:hypothetical protein